MRISILTKFLLTMVAVALFTLGPVTWIAVRGFLDDKRLDVFDRNNLIGRNVASESHDVLAGAVGKMRVFANVYLDPAIPEAKRADVAKDIFSHYAEFVRISILEPGKDPIRIYNTDALRRGGFTEKNLDGALDKVPVPEGAAPEGGVWVLNRTPTVELPVITVATDETLTGGKKVKLVGDLLPEALFNLFQSESATKIFMLDADRKILAHSDAAKMVSREAPAGLTAPGSAVLSNSLTSEFTDENGERQLFTEAAVGLGRATVIAYTPERVAFAPARRLVGNSVAVTAAVFLIAAVVSLLLARQMTRPLLGLSQATGKIAKGEFGTTVAVTTGDEIGDLARSFNQMGAELNTREKKLEEARMALVQSEKMAAFGQLGAGIAHEVKNPLAGILGYAQLAIRKIKPEDATMKGYLEIIEKETKRCKAIIENLLKFARQEKTVMDKVDVPTLLEDSMKLVEHQLNMNGVKIEKKIDAGLPPIFANANQLQQVLMNLSINAQHAMEKGGMLTVAAAQAGDSIEIKVSDTGTGMPKEIMTKIFEPFFTTKPAGKGTGLGLSVTYGIIRDHKGTIAVDSTVGVGTTFKITLPVAKGDAPAAEAEKVAQSQS